MARRLAAKITGVAGYVPPRVVTNYDISKTIDTNEQWISERTGIRERHVSDKGVSASHLGFTAAKQLLTETETEPEEINLIIVATVTPDMFFPATACIIQNRLGASRAWGFDLSGACSGFLFALTVASQFVAEGSVRKALVIGSDVMSTILNYDDRTTCVIFGDGAGAALVERAESENEGILDFYHDIDGSGAEYLFMPGGGSLHPAAHETVDRKMHCVHQVGSRVFKYAVRRMSDVACQLLTQNGYSVRDLALLVPHQANLRIIRGIQERLGIEDSKMVTNIDRYANTAGATIPLCLCDAVAQGRLRKGDLALLIAVGAGYTTGGILMRWAY